MGRVVVGLLVCAVAASAAPPPKESPENKLRRLFGAPFDPEKDCNFTLDGNQLKIKVAGTPHRFTPGYETETSLAPRTKQQITGDFDLRVVVVSVTPPGAKTDGLGMTAGGLFIATDADKFVTLSRYTTRADDGDGANPQFLLQHYLPDTNGSNLSAEPEELKGKPVHLRLVREKNKVTGYTSADGKTWAMKGVQNYAWPETVSVGVFASHGVNHAVEGVFEGLTVTQPEKEPSK
jgi:hypothetical protein